MDFIDATIGGLLANMMEYIFSAVAWITAQIGYLLDMVIDEFVLNMAETVNSIGAIEGLWQVFRDLGNIFFIGVLLYIAIRTILDVGNSFNTKRILTRLIIVALFVNFSLFATKVIVDTSNVVALQFYNSIQVEGCGEEECNISHFFASATNISSVQSAESIRSESTIRSAENTNFRIFLARILGTTFLIVTGFVMAAIALLLVIRFGMLILLMIASPLAFIAFILPSVHWGKQWFDKLLNQSFFAPALFAMIYVVASLASGLQNNIAGAGNTNLMAAILSPNPGSNFGVILVFILMIILMAATLVVAKNMGAAGATKAIEIGQKARNWGQATIVGGTAAAAGATMRGTFGKVGKKADDKLKKSRFAQGYYGSKIRDVTTKKAANAKFGTKKSASQISGEKKKAKGRVASYEARERAKNKVKNASNDAEKRRALSDLSSNEKMDLGKSFLMANANLLSENDIKAIKNNDKFSERDKREIENNRYNPVKDAAKKAAEAANKGDEDAREEAVSAMKEALGSLSNNEIKNNLDINIETADAKEQERNQQLIDEMSSNQFETFKKSKSKSEQDRLTSMRLQPLRNAINNNNVGEYLGGMKEEEISKLLKMADDDMRSDGQVIDEVSPKVLSELADSLKAGEKENMRNAVYDRYTDPNNPQISDKNQRSAEWLDNGPGKALF